MTPDALRLLLGELPSPNPPWPPIEEPNSLLAAVERACERAPTDLGLARLLHVVHALATAGGGVPPVIAGVRRETLVRWDDWTATWDGVETASGGPARVRTLRAWAARDPVLRRALIRDGKALRDALPADAAVVVHEGEWPAITARLSGSPLTPGADPEDHERPEILARMLGTALASLRRYEALGLTLPVLDARELLDGPDGIAIVCLGGREHGGRDRRHGDGDARRHEPGEQGEQVARIAAALDRWWGAGPPTPVDALLGGFQELPPRAVEEAVETLRTTLVDHLVGERHAAQRKLDRWRHATRVQRLRAAVSALDVALPPPTGRGAVGVDLDGHTTVLESRDGRITWGPVDRAVDVYLPGRGLVVKEARRLLRTRAESPSNARLHAKVGGDAASVDGICRWIAAALELRTTRLLLEVQVQRERTAAL